MIRSPDWTDNTHPIYTALPIADALDAMDALNLRAGDERIEALVIEAGDLAGGLSVHGFRHDVLWTVNNAERERDEEVFDDHATRRHLGFYDRNRDPCREARQYARDIASDWVENVTALLKQHGFEFGAGRIARVAAESVG